MEELKESNVKYAAVNGIRIVTVSLMRRKENKGMEKVYTLFIDTWSSECGNCGKGCNPDEKSHLTNIGYGVKDSERKGCGIEWEYLSTHHRGMGEDFYKRIKKMRPDLEFYIDNPPPKAIEE